MLNLSSQVVRVQSFGKGSLGAIGKEVERTEKDIFENRNSDIDKSRTSLNDYFKHTKNGLYGEWNDVCKELNVTNADKLKKNAIAFEGMVITSDKEFFENMGYVPGEKPPWNVQGFFERAYEFAKKEIGFHGTDANILSAVVHYDETTPHLQLYYVPIVDSWKVKVLKRDAEGKVLKNEKGSSMQERDENGKLMWTEVKDSSERKLSRESFWKNKGGNTSYTKMQDRFYSSVSKIFDLGRGQVGSTREHTTKSQWEIQKLENKKEEIFKNKTAIEREIKGGIFTKDGKMVITPGLENEVLKLTEQKEQLHQETQNLVLQLNNKKQEYDFFQKKTSKLGKKYLEAENNFSSLQDDLTKKITKLEQNYDAAKKKYDITPIKQQYETVKLLYGDPVELKEQAILASETLREIQDKISEATLSIASLKKQNGEIGQNIASQTMILNHMDMQIKEKESFLEHLEKIISQKIYNILENFWHDAQDSIYFAKNGETDLAEYSLQVGQKKAYEDAAVLPEEPKQILNQSIEQKVEEITETYIRPRKRGR